jgi:hypothetical protein
MMMMISKNANYRASRNVRGGGGGDNDDLARLVKYSEFLGVLAKLQKGTISVIMSVCLSVLVEQLGSHWMDFDEIWCLRHYRKTIGTLHEDFPHL